MSDSDKNWERQLGSPPQCSSAAMSFQSAIPWQVALRQSLPPLHRLATILNNPLCRTMIFQRTVTTPLTSCLTPWVHFKIPTPLPPAPELGLTFGRGQLDSRMCGVWVRECASACAGVKRASMGMGMRKSCSECTRLFPNSRKIVRRSLRPAVAYLASSSGQLSESTFFGKTCWLD
jgi:hypothetical protein